MAGARFSHRCPTVRVGITDADVCCPDPPDTVAAHGRITAA
ncbi:hypothetical protein AB0O39_33910 [Streptomyces anulatus]